MHIKKSTAHNKPALHGKKKKSLKKKLHTTTKRRFNVQAPVHPTPTPDELLGAGSKVEPLIDYAALKPKSVKIAEVEMGLLTQQIGALEHLISEALPPLTEEEQTTLHIQMLQKKAADLRSEYANNPRSKEVVQEFEQLGLKAPSLIRNNPTYMGEGYMEMMKVTTKGDKRGRGGFVINSETEAKAKKLFAEKNLTQDTPLDRSAPTPKANLRDDTEGQRQLAKQRADKRKAKMNKSPWAKYYELTKPRISQMVAVTSAWGYFSVGNTTHDWKDLALLTAGTISLSSAASIINQMRETDVDAKMTRTMSRPLVTGSISMDSAKKQTMAYIAAGTALLSPLHTLVPILGLANVVLYSGIYTSLKRTTKLNTEIGALVGAIPPIMGYFTALTSDQSWDQNLTALLYPAAMMIAWQMQHVMLICARRGDEYNASGLVMQCKDDPGLKSTIRKGNAWVVASTALAAAPFFSGQADITQLFAVYIWALYAAPYIYYMNKQDKGKLHKILMAGYAVLGVTIILSLQANIPVDPFQHLVIEGPMTPTPLPVQPPSFLDVMIGGEGKPLVGAEQELYVQQQAEKKAAIDAAIASSATTTGTPAGNISTNVPGAAKLASVVDPEVQNNARGFADLVKNFFLHNDQKTTSTSAIAQPSSHL